jgi:hypothetical protein
LFVSAAFLALPQQAVKSVDDTLERGEQAFYALTVFLCRFPQDQQGKRPSQRCHGLWRQVLLESQQGRILASGEEQEHEIDLVH